MSATRRLTRAEGFADGAEEGGHLGRGRGAVAEAGGLVELGELRDWRGNGVCGEGGCEFERGLRRGFLPAAFFEEAQHFAILERRQGSCQISAATRANTPSRDEIANQRASTQINQQANEKREDAGQKIGRRFGAMV